MYWRLNIPCTKGENEGGLQVFLLGSTKLSLDCGLQFTAVSLQFAADLKHFAFSYFYYLRWARQQIFLLYIYVIINGWKTVHFTKTTNLQVLPINFNFHISLEKPNWLSWLGARQTLEIQNVAYNRSILLRI